VLAFAAVILYALALRRQRMGLAIASALLYLAAALCKEIFVPLPLIFFAMSRKKYLIPQIVAGIVYAVLASRSSARTPRPTTSW